MTNENTTKSFESGPERVTGWIRCKEDEKEYLESIGVKLGPIFRFGNDEDEFETMRGKVMFQDCELNTEILKILESDRKADQSRFQFDLTTDDSRASAARLERRRDENRKNY